MKKAITLVYDPVCPFAQRVWLTLLEKQIPFEKKVIDLGNKSQEFKDIYSKAYARDVNSQGAVPVLIYGDQVISQSDLLVWLLSEDFQTGADLIPKDNFQKLKARWFTKNVTSKLITAFYAPIGMNKKSEEEQQKIKARMNSALLDLEGQIVGPYVLGEQFTVADIMVYPWLQRLAVLNATYNIELPAECKKVKELKRLVEQRPSAVETIKEANLEYLIKRYTPYFIKE